jgi:glyoxylase-like metal-dependent hydrolase (beta-lactamase superfamily II)
MKKIASNVYASTKYPGVNVGFVAVPEGAIAIDAPTLPQDARAWRQQIEDIANGPILYVVLTDVHPDRLLSTGLMGAPIVAARMAYRRASAFTDGFWRSVVDGWARRNPESADDLSRISIVLPEIVFDGSLTLRKGGGDVTVNRIVGSAPGSAWVHLLEQDVLFTGDTLTVNAYPIMDATPDTKAWLNTLKSLRRSRYAETTIVPGRGPLCDQSATIPLSEYIALARRRARSLQATERSRLDKATIVNELLSFFPVPDDERDWVQRRVRAGLDRLFEELEAS